MVDINEFIIGKEVEFRNGETHIVSNVVERDASVIVEFEERFFAGIDFGIGSRWLYNNDGTFYRVEIGVPYDYDIVNILGGFGSFLRRHNL